MIKLITVMHMNNWLIFYLKLYFKLPLIDTVSSLFPAADTIIFISSCLCTFTYSTIYFLLPSSFTLFSSFLPSELFPSPFSTLHSTNFVEESDNGDIQSVHPFAFKDVGREVCSRSLDLCQYNSEEVFLYSDHVGRPKLSITRHLQVSFQRAFVVHA